jgi:hypothetical protein
MDRRLLSLRRYWIYDHSTEDGQIGSNCCNQASVEKVDFQQRLIKVNVSGFRAERL